jgi:hypothetical protein
MKHSAADLYRITSRPIFGGARGCGLAWMALTAPAAWQLASRFSFKFQVLPNSSLPLSRRPPRMALRQSESHVAELVPSLLAVLSGAATKSSMLAKLNLLR